MPRAVTQRSATISAGRSKKTCRPQGLQNALNRYPWQVELAECVEDDAHARRYSRPMHGVQPVPNRFGHWINHTLNSSRCTKNSDPPGEPGTCLCLRHSLPLTRFGRTQMGTVCGFGNTQHSRDANGSHEGLNPKAIDLRIVHRIRLAHGERPLLVMNFIAAWQASVEDSRR